MNSWLPWLLSPTLVWSWIGIAVLVCLSLRFIAAPYGRFARAGWGPGVPVKIGWVLMESVVLLVFGAFFWAGLERGGVALLLFGLFAGHYGYRAVLYPMWMQSRGRTMPLSIVLMSMVFNTVNGALNGAALFHASGGVGLAVSGPRMWLGIGLMLVGFVIHVRSDAILRRLRRENHVDYAVPHGFLYRWVSCPNYLGEIIQWVGWAVLCWNLAALSFAVWTVANLAPRALDHHRWYRERFEDYPSRRRALIPGVF